MEGAYVFAQIHAKTDKETRTIIKGNINENV